MSKLLHYSVILRAEPEGGFTAIVPSLPGCVTYGQDLSEAKMMARDAIHTYLASLKKHGERIVSDNDDFITIIDIEQKPSRRAVYA